MKHQPLYLIRKVLLRAGDRVRVDGGFTCIPEGSVLTVKIDEGGMFIKCNEGQHYLSGQIENFYVGIELVEDE